MAIKAAVIGAGLAGLACARTLHDAGWDIDVFEAEEAIGGRMASMKLGSALFDHGTPYVVPRNPLFQGYIASIAAKGYAAPWRPRDSAADTGEQRGPVWYVGTPSMTGMLRPLADGLRVHTSCPVHTIKRTQRTWNVWFEDETTTGPFAAVAIAIPAPKALMLLGPIDIFEKGLTSVRMAPCWSLQVHTPVAVLGDQDIYGELSDKIRWVARNNTKPRRQKDTECLVVQASQVWSRATEDDDPEAVAEELWADLCQRLSIPGTVRPIAMRAHLWRHGFATRPLGETYLYSTEHKLGAAGDWCRGRLAEHAYGSGVGLAKAMIGSM
jgi:renalase